MKAKKKGKGCIISLGNTLIGLHLINIIIFLSIATYGCKPDEPSKPAYTQEEVSKKLLKQQDSLESLYTQKQISAIQIIKDRLYKDINKTQTENLRIKQLSSKQELIIKELSIKLGKDSTMANCVALLNAKDKQLYNKDTEITNLEIEAQYWCELQDSTESQSQLKTNLIIHKDSVIYKERQISNDLSLDLKKAKDRADRFEVKYNKNKSNFWRGFGLGIGATLGAIGAITLL